MSSNDLWRANLIKFCQNTRAWALALVFTLNFAKETKKIGLATIQMLLGDMLLLRSSESVPVPFHREI